MHAPQETIVAIATTETHPAASPDCHCLPKRTHTRTGPVFTAHSSPVCTWRKSGHRHHPLFDDPPDRWKVLADSVALFCFIRLDVGCGCVYGTPWSVDGPDDRWPGDTAAVTSSNLTGRMISVRRVPPAGRPLSPIPREWTVGAGRAHGWASCTRNATRLRYSFIQDDCRRMLNCWCWCAPWQATARLTSLALSCKARLNWCAVRNCSLVTYKNYFQNILFLNFNLI